ncbi:hypothetical protein HHL17_04940 [Chitinophaga sp. G-6-1-13]|uniref:Uncharacterized protein n=1 Tax=Chitinophaga fulva TaxID=2728842 RepID=A0A848GER2_9BACT|nr:hypothetical protein [Chitinophaga fulva]NML36536.1 hypothetical protein [Chitinophaga fulva]
MNPVFFVGCESPPEEYMDPLSAIYPRYYSTMLIEDSIRVEFPHDADRKLLFATPLNFSGNTFTARTIFHAGVPVYVYGRFNTAITAGFVSDSWPYVQFPDRNVNAVVLQYAILCFSGTGKTKFSKRNGRA